MYSTLAGLTPRRHVLPELTGAGTSTAGRRVDVALANPSGEVLESKRALRRTPTRHDESTSDQGSPVLCSRNPVVLPELPRGTRRVAVADVPDPKSPASGSGRSVLQGTYRCC